MVVVTAPGAGRDASFHFCTQILEEVHVCVCAASRKVMHDGSLFFRIVGCGIIVYFLGVAGGEHRDAVGLIEAGAEETEKYEARCMGQEPQTTRLLLCWCVSISSDRSISVYSAWHFVVQICKLHRIAAGIDVIDKSVIGHYKGENVSSNQQPLIISLCLWSIKVDEHDSSTW